MKKRLFSALLAASMTAMLLTGCSGNTSDDNVTAPDTNVDSTAQSGDQIGMTMVFSQRDEFLSILAGEMESAAKANNVKLTVTDALSDTSKQLQFVETARNNGDQVVIVNLVDAATAPEIIEKAGDMKVVFVNRQPEDLSVLNEKVIYVGSNEFDAGALQAEALCEYFAAKGQTDVKYILLSGIIGNVSTTNRTAAVIDGMAAGGLNATEASAPLNAKYDRTEAMDKISPLLSSGLAFDCIIANSDSMALGAIEAMESMGMDPGSVPIVGVDCLPDGAAAVQAGKMYATAYQNPIGQGNASLIAAINLANGDPINKNTGYEIAEDNANIIWVPFEKVTAENVSDYL